MSKIDANGIKKTFGDFFDFEIKVHNLCKTVKIISHKAKYIINSNCLLTENGNLIDKSLYENFAYAQKSLSVEDEFLEKLQDVHVSLLTLLDKIDNSFFLNYDIKVFEKTKIIFSSREHNFYLILKEKNLLQPAAINLAVDTLKTKNLKKNCYFADLRFKGQLIINFENKNSKKGEIV